MHPKGNVLIFLLVSVVAVIFATYIVIENTSRSYLRVLSNKKPPTNIAKILSPDELVYQYSGKLTGVRDQKLNGKVNTAFIDGSFTVYAKINNLSNPQPSHKYYGWIGKRGETGQIKYINIGQAVKNDDYYVNIFQGATDISTHTFYALSEESDSQEPQQPTSTIGESILTKNEIQPTPKKINN
jgi:hypothetical protein